MVRTERLELSHLAAPEPKSGVSTNSTTSAHCFLNLLSYCKWCGRRDSNSHTLLHQNLNLACLPIPPRPHKTAILTSFSNNGVDNGARTHDRRNHNPELYQLSYTHHRGPFKWCGRRDSNSHTLRHQNLNLACLPIPPRPL